MRQERRPKVWATSFPHLLTLTQKEKKRKEVKTEGNDYLQKTHHNWTKTNELQRPCFKQDTKANQRWLRPCEHCALSGFYGKNNKSMVPNVSQLLTKNKTFKLNQSLTCADFGTYVATCVICHEQYVGQTSN